MQAPTSTTSDHHNPEQLYHEPVADYYDRLRDLSAKSPLFPRAACYPQSARLVSNYSASPLPVYTTQAHLRDKPSQVKHYVFRQTTRN